MEDTLVLFSCQGKHKDKKHPTDPSKDHVTFYKCVAGKKEWDKVKLYPNKHVLKMSMIEYYELKPVEENSKQPEPESKDE